MKYGTKKYDKSLKKICHFQKFPEMLPWIGKDYDSRNHKKLLIIGESHYLPERSTVHKNPCKWYRLSSHKLSKREREWINTRQIIDSGRNQKWESKAHWIYRNVELILKRVFKPNDTTNMFQYIAFTNYFYRPAKNGQSIELSPDDKKHSREIIQQVVSKIKPDIVCFVSTTSYETAKEDSIISFLNSRRIKYDYTPHPTCPWWNRSCKKYGNRTGKGKLLSLLKKSGFCGNIKKT